MKKNITAIALFAALALLVTGALSAYVLLSPARTWDSPPNYIVDNRGLAGVNDSDGGATRTVNAIVSSSAWNGAGSGTVVTDIRTMSFEPLTVFAFGSAMMKPV